MITSRIGRILGARPDNQVRGAETPRATSATAKIPAKAGATKRRRRGPWRVLGILVPLVVGFAGVVITVYGPPGQSTAVSAHTPRSASPTLARPTTHRSSASASVLVASALSDPASESSGQSPRIVFSDRFCTAKGGWTVGRGHTGGHYAKCAFRIYANANGDIESSDPRARAVYPVAPSKIEITVTARRLLGKAEGDSFGVVCRAGGEGYAFIVQSNMTEIIKYSASTGQIGQPLARVRAVVDMNARNKIQATCSSASGGAAQLALSINGKKLAKAIDKNSPIRNGTVGIFTATTSATVTPTEVEFNNFIVTQA